MSGSTNVPIPTFGPTGFIAPTESEILQGRLADIDQAFGGGVNQALTTPQGQLASSDTAIIGNCNDQFLALVNGIDPAYAAGRMQDAIGRIYFITRIPAAATVTQVTCSGGTGVVIPVGAQLQDNAGNRYAATQSGTIPVSGSIVLAFACTILGAVACPAQTFAIVQSIAGWDSAISSAGGTTGNAVESRTAFERRRSASVALNATGSVPAITAAVLSVSGVLDAYVIDNPTSVSVVTGGVTLAPNSIYVAVVGGLAASVAQAIWRQKSCGCSYNGNTTVVVQDTASGYSPPVPSYNVTFEIPTATAVLFAVTIATSTAVPSNAAALIQAAIATAFTGGDGGSRARIGSTIYASRFYGPVAALGAWAQIIAIQIGVISANQNDITMPINQAPVTSAGNISVSFA